MDKVISGPWGNRRSQSARAIEMERVEGAFRKLKRNDDDVFQHLARKVAGYLEEAESHSSRSGNIGKIIGGDTDRTARHRNRFSWNGQARDFKKQPLAKNPGQWIALLRRCAEVLNRTPEAIFLEAFSGSRLRPATVPTDFTQASWLNAFLDLMERLEKHICEGTDITDLFKYLISSHIRFCDGEAHDFYFSAIPQISPDIPEYSDILDQIPFVKICTDLSGYHPYPSDNLSYPDELSLWSQILKHCFDTNIPNNYDMRLALYIRRGLTIIPGEPPGGPRLALYKWPFVELEASSPEAGDQSPPIFSIPDFSGQQIAGELLVSEFPEFAPHMMGNVSIAPLGTEAFNAVVIERFFEFDDAIGGMYEDEGCWDPHFDSPEIEYSSYSPKTTVAARIERNLLFADWAGVPSKRIDRLLEIEISSKSESVRRHRNKSREILERRV